jgi:hypothetical protein
LEHRLSSARSYRRCSSTATVIRYHRECAQVGRGDAKRATSRDERHRPYPVRRTRSDSLAVDRFLKGDWPEECDSRKPQ